MPFFRLFFGLLLIFLANVCWAQLPNEAFQRSPQVKPEYAKELRLGINALGFFKDNEYFNKIADGYTLFGYQLTPSLQYYPSEKIKIEAGALLLKDFGNQKYKLIQPTFTATFTTGNHTILFGTLNGNLNFGYIEPLWDFERQLLVPLQNGIQYVYDSPRFDFQGFIDWQIMQYPFDTKQEEIAGGFTNDIIIWSNYKQSEVENSSFTYINYTHKLKFPMQFTGQHKGGQIDLNDRPLTTIFNAALGLDYTFYIWNSNEGASNYGPVTVSPPKRLIKSLYTKNYFVGYNDHSFTHQLPFQGGSGIYLNAGADTRWANFMLSYWNGNGYISEFGGKIYQSVSTTVHNPDFIEKKRQLLILRIMKDWNVGDGLTFTGRLEPFYDFTAKSTEFSAGLYLNFNTDFFLTKIKRNHDR